MTTNGKYYIYSIWLDGFSIRILRSTIERDFFVRIVHFIANAMILLHREVSEETFISLIGLIYELALADMSVSISQSAFPRPYKAGY